METVKHELDDASNEARFVNNIPIWTLIDFPTKNIWILVFPPKIISSNYPFRMAEDKAHRTMLDAAKLADELRMEQDNTTR